MCAGVVVSVGQVKRIAERPAESRVVTLAPRWQRPIDAEARRSRLGETAKRKSLLQIRGVGRKRTPSVQVVAGQVVGVRAPSAASERASAGVRRGAVAARALTPRSVPAGVTRRSVRADVVVVVGHVRVSAAERGVVVGGRALVRASGISPTKRCPSRRKFFRQSPGSAVPLITSRGVLRSWCTRWRHNVVTQRKSA